MARQLLRPSLLDVGLRSGLFISGARRTGKTTFLRHDLIPALQVLGAIVIYVDLWQDITASPAILMQDAIRRCLKDLQTPSSALLKRLSKLKSADITALGLKFAFDIDQVGEKFGVTLAQALTETVDLAKSDVVLVVDEVQQAVSTDEGRNMLFGLKAARDTINLRPQTEGHFIFIGTGSHRAMVNELTARNNQAFSGATSIAYPCLGEDYVAWLTGRLARQGFEPLPSLNAASEVFSMLGHKPEDFLRALRALKGAEHPDDALRATARALCTAATDAEIQKIMAMGGLAIALFDRITSASEGVRGVFSAKAVAGYSNALGRPVRVEEIQPIANQLLDANLIIRCGYGSYAVADPAVQARWLENRPLLEQL
ncbi:MAG: ATP-binding protein [Betaproteobacteria bacterium]|nr:ATP-binding protein [Betaproteobacteria bacterium]